MCGSTDVMQAAACLLAAGDILLLLTFHCAMKGAYCLVVLAFTLNPVSSASSFLSEASQPLQQHKHGTEHTSKHTFPAAANHSVQLP